MSAPTRYLPQAGTLASTLCILAAVPPVSQSQIIWVALVPWFMSLRRCRTSVEAVTQGFWLNVLLGFGGAFWVAPAAQRYLDVSLTLGLLVLLVHALVHQLQLVVFGALHWRATRAAPPARFLDALGLAFLYTGLDWLTPKLFGDSLGLVLISFPSLRQLAAWGGMELLTFIVVLVNLVVYALAVPIWDARAEHHPVKARPLRPGVWLLCSLGVFVGLGSIENARVASAIGAAGRTLRVGFVQGNVPDDVRRRWSEGDPEASLQSLEVYVRGTEQLLALPTLPELIVWPETSYPGVFRKPESDAQLQLNVAFDRAIASFGVPIAFGAYDREDRSDRRVLRNALYLVEPRAEQPRDQLSPMSVYHKSTLFPIGEYVPFFDESTVRSWLPGSAHLSRGDGPRVLELGSGALSPLRIGPSICYEDVSARHATELARDGAELLLNVSNDSWFGDDGAAQWHLMMATLRSVETRLPQVRATSSGFSGFILPSGEVHEPTEFREEATRTFDLPLVHLGPTLRTRLGDWFGPFSLVVGILWLLASRARLRDARQRRLR
ncbi:MAG: apolipoprotein N-acyltransferase [Deltaproteobacteria bacterium]|jgi:apolipoprotein N-acyltransferase|nr:apolipoprotein N-acyltransferase [Deltaproteobacteria bacterium]